MSLQERVENLGPTKFEQFSNSARAVLVSAENHARDCGRGLLRRQDLFWALVQDEGVAEVFRDLNMSFPVDTIESFSGKKHIGDIRLSEHSQEIIELAILETRRRKDGIISPVDLLIGIINVPDGEGKKALESLRKKPSDTPLLDEIRAIVPAAKTGEKITSDNPKPKSASSA